LITQTSRQRRETAYALDDFDPVTRAAVAITIVERLSSARFSVGDGSAVGRCSGVFDGDADRVIAAECVTLPARLPPSAVR
jgi:hypothetical protein